MYWGRQSALMLAASRCPGPGCHAFAALPAHFLDSFEDTKAFEIALAHYFNDKDRCAMSPAGKGPAQKGLRLSSLTGQPHGAGGAKLP